MTRLYREWPVDAYWWHARRGNLAIASAAFHAELIEADRRLQAVDARARYLRARRARAL